jgi:hypothetical protein
MLDTDCDDKIYSILANNQVLNTEKYQSIKRFSSRSLHQTEYLPSLPPERRLEDAFLGEPDKPKKK